jgi:hypothetical protein
VIALQSTSYDPPTNHLAGEAIANFQMVAYVPLVFLLCHFLREGENQTKEGRYACTRTRIYTVTHTSDNHTISHSVFVNSLKTEALE